MTLQPGTLDTAFANAGVLEWPFPEFASISPEAVVPLPDGRLLVVASDPAYPQGFIVARLTEAGRLDVGTGFGDREQGFVQIAIPDKSLRWNASASLLGDGRLLVTYDYSGLTTGERGYVVMLLLSDGCLDEGFGEGGVVAFPFGSLPATLERTGKAAYADVSAGEAVESVTHGGAYLAGPLLRCRTGRLLWSVLALILIRSKPKAWSCDSILMAVLTKPLTKPARPVLNWGIRVTTPHVEWKLIRTEVWWCTATLMRGGHSVSTWCASRRMERGTSSSLQ